MNPYASIHVSYCQRIDLLDVEYGIEDVIVFQWSAVTGDGTAVTSTVRRSRVRTNQNGDSYIISEGRRWYLNEAIRIN